MNNKKILLIEDNEIDFLSFTRMLQKNNLPVSITHAFTPGEAMQYLNTTKFDLIISDFRLPGDAIYEFEKHFSDTSFIIVTGLADEEVRNFCFRYNAQAYFIKDIDGHYLLTLPVFLNNFLSKDD